MASGLAVFPNELWFKEQSTLFFITNNLFGCFQSALGHWNEQMDRYVPGTKNFGGDRTIVTKETLYMLTQEDARQLGALIRREILNFKPANTDGKEYIVHIDTIVESVIKLIGKIREEYLKIMAGWTKEPYGR